MTRRWVACALGLAFALAGCSGSSDGAPDVKIPTASATADAAAVEEKAVLDAFERYWDEQVAIANSGKVPKDALKDSATGPQREYEIARLTKDAQKGLTRSGAPKFKDQKVTVTADTALVVTCINDVDWPFTLADGTTPAPPDAWRQLGRELTKVDGAWLVTGGSPENTSETCP